MTRYFARPDKPRGHWLDDDPLLPALTVDDTVPVPTGLVDRHGHQIMRAPAPCGFHNPRER